MRKVVYLTIDDVPTDDFPNKIDFLLENKIPSIFFIIGQSVNESRRPALVEAIKKGFILGNHSFSHPDFSTISLEEVKNEIEKTDKIIEDLYSEAGEERRFKVFRFPFLRKGGANKQAIQDILEGLGYAQPGFENINYKWYKNEGHHKDYDVFCTFDTLDWAVANETSEEGVKDLDSLLERMDENFPEKGKGLNDENSSDIVMMHDDIRISNLFKPILLKMIEKGIKFGDFN